MAFNRLIVEKASETKEMTLWDRLGGETNVKKVVHQFVLAAASDPKVDFTRGGKFKILEGPEKFHRFVIFFCQCKVENP